MQGISDFEEIMFELFVFNCIIYSNRFLLNLIIEKKIHQDISICSGNNKIQPLFNTNTCNSHKKWETTDF